MDHHSEPSKWPFSCAALYMAFNSKLFGVTTLMECFGNSPSSTGFLKIVVAFGTEVGSNRTHQHVFFSGIPLISDPHSSRIALTEVEEIFPSKARNFGFPRLISFRI